MFEWIYEPQAWVALLTLTALEIVLGIDNIIFISILVSRLPERLQQKARTIGLSLAMLTRIALLLALAWIMKLGPVNTNFKTALQLQNGPGKARGEQFGHSK